MVWYKTLIGCKQLTYTVCGIYVDYKYIVVRAYKTYVSIQYWHKDICQYLLFTYFDWPECFIFQEFVCYALYLVGFTPHLPFSISIIPSLQQPNPCLVIDQSNSTSKHLLWFLLLRSQVCTCVLSAQRLCIQWCLWCDSDSFHPLTIQVYVDNFWSHLSCFSPGTWAI